MCFDCVSFLVKTKELVIVVFFFVKSKEESERWVLAAELLPKTQPFSMTSSFDKGSGRSWASSTICCQIQVAYLTLHTLFHYFGHMPMAAVTDPNERKRTVVAG